MTRTLINYLMSGIVGTALGVVTLMGSGTNVAGVEVACEREDDCASPENRIAPCPSGVSDCAAPEAMEVACSSGNGGCDNGINVAIAPCTLGVDCHQPQGDDLLLACDREDCQSPADEMAPCDSANGCDDITVARIAPCDLSDPDCDDRVADRV